MGFLDRNAALYRWVQQDIAGKTPALIVDGSLVEGVAGATTVGCTEFEQLIAPDEKYGAIVFAACLNAMDARAALAKAKALVRKGGRVIAFGNCSPASPLGWATSMLRAVKPAPGNLPTMAEVEELISAELPGARIQRVLGGRYYAVWDKR